MVSDVLNLLVATRSEIFLLALLTSSKVVGVYALAFGIAGQLTAPVDALLGPLVPAASGLVGREPAKAAIGYLRAVRVSTLLATCLMVIAVPAISRLIPVIYGHSFDDASRLFVALAISSCFATCLNPTIAFLAAHRAAGTALWTNVVALAVDGVIAVALIPFIGAYGAVCAAVAASVVRLLVWTRTEVRRLGLAWRPFLVDVVVFVTGAVLVVLGVIVGVHISGPAGVVVEIAAPILVFFADASRRRLGALGCRQRPDGGGAAVALASLGAIPAGRRRASSPVADRSPVVPLPFLPRTAVSGPRRSRSRPSPCCRRSATPSRRAADRRGAARRAGGCP